MILKNAISKIVIKKATDEGALIVLPEKGSVMKLENHTNMLERPYTFIADLESTLLRHKSIKVYKNEDPVNTQIIHEHKPNSCCYYFICTFDNRRNELKTLKVQNA